MKTHTVQNPQCTVKTMTISILFLGIHYETAKHVNTDIQLWLVLELNTFVQG